MTEVATQINQNSEEMYSLEEVIKIFYFSGVTTFGLWEELLEKLKPLLLEDLDLISFTLHQKLSFVINSYKDNLTLTEINSQLKIYELKNYVLSLDEIFNYIKSHIDDLFTKCYKKNLVLNFKSIIAKILQNTNENIAENSDEDSDNNNEDSEDEFNKIFDSIKSDSSEKKKDKKKKIAQSLIIAANDKQKILTTPGEWGSHLIKIEVTDTRDLKGVPKSDRWKKISQKAIFFVKSSEDNNFKELNKILQNVGKNIASTIGVKKDIKKIYRNKPY